MGRRTEEERYWAKVDQRSPDECWVWTASTNKDGYGCFGSQCGRSEVAHRVAWRLAFGSIPAGLCVLHRCDNPPCQNPAHLFLGTRQDNNWDKLEKGRQPQGEAVGGARLSAGQVREIHRRYGEGESGVSLATEFGVHSSLVGSIVSGNHWKSLGLSALPPRRRNFSGEEVLEIRRRRRAGEPLAALAADFDSSTSGIWGAANLARLRAGSHR